MRMIALSPEADIRVIVSEKVCLWPKEDTLVSNHLLIRLNDISLTDIKAARSAGAEPYLVKTGKGLRSIDNASEQELDNIPIFDDLNDVTNHLLNSY